MSKLSVEKSWTECMALWKWVSHKCKGKSVTWCEQNTTNLKRVWLKAHGYENLLIQNCFFCDLALQIDFCNCSKCPGKKVDMNFSCANDAYCYDSKPCEFYAELKRLNKIRLGNYGTK